MKTKEITLREFRNLSRAPESNMVREMCLDGFLVCRIFQAGKEIAKSVTRWVSDSREVKYSLLT